MNQLGALLAGGTPPPRRELLCGPGVIMWLRVLMPEHDPSFPWSQTPPFAGIPLIHSPDLGLGEWELRVNDEVASSGRFDLPEPPDFGSLVPPAMLSLKQPPPFSVLDRLAWASVVRPSYPLVLGSVI